MKKPDILDKKYQIYLDERKSLFNSKYESSRSFDRAILTLAAGALGLSITFIKQIAPCPKSNTHAFIILSWICFGLSILSTLISFLTSQKACERQIKILEDIFVKHSNNFKTNIYSRWTARLNFTSIALFIVGVILLLIFSALNF